MVVTRADWPESGRIGLCRSGEYAGWYALLVPEVEGWWACYLRDPESESEDDFSVSDEGVTEVVGQMEIAWLQGEDAKLREREVFGLWDEWSAAGRKSWGLPGNVFRKHR
jgi:hypothetical protein